MEGKAKYKYFAVLAITVHVITSVRSRGGGRVGNENHVMQLMRCCGARDCAASKNSPSFQAAGSDDSSEFS